jgi:hypothetical protein
MRSSDIIDAELTTLYAKVEQLTKERDAALELAEQSAGKFIAMRTECENYRHLWEEATDRLTRFEANQKKNWLSWFKS